MNLDSDRYTKLMLLLLLCMTSVPSLAVEKDTGTAVLVGRAFSLTDVDSFKPIEYSRQSDDVIIGLRYGASTPVKIQIFGDGTVRGERIHSTSVRADNGVYAQVKVKHTFTAQLSGEHMQGMLKSMAGLFNLELATVKKELSESVNCWDYCPDVIIYDGPGITAELEINVLTYTLISGNIIENANKVIKWDKTDVFEAAAKFPQVYDLQELKGAIEELLDFCDCVPAHAN